MEENDIVDSGDIFTSPEAVEGMKSAAEALGANPENVNLSKPQVAYFAKSNCKSCNGLGVLLFVPSPTKAKKVKLKKLDMLMEKQIRKSRWTFKNGKRVRKPTQKAIGFVTEFPGNQLTWNTRRREALEYKHNHAEQRPCKCLSSVEM